MKKKNEQQCFKSPQLNTYAIKIHSIICQSGGNVGMKEVIYGDGGFEEEQ